MVDGDIEGAIVVGGDIDCRWLNCWTFAAEQHLARGDSGSYSLTEDDAALGLFVGGTLGGNRNVFQRMWIQDLASSVGATTGHQWRSLADRPNQPAVGSA
jgi:hypothetical protein